MHPAKQLLIDLKPLAFTLGGFTLHNIHEVLGMVVLGLSGVYTTFKIYHDFFNKDKPKK